MGSPLEPDGPAHTPPRPPRALRGARIFTAGAAAGFVAGAFAVAVVVWQFGNVIGSREGAADGAAPRPAVERWTGEPIDADWPVLESAVATTGDSPTPEPSPADAPALSAPPDRAPGIRDLEMPVEGVDAGDLVRSFEDARGMRKHEAIDIMAPHGTPVKAVEDGRIARLFISKAGGITIYQFDPTERFCYYYAHLDRYAEGLREDAVVRQGQVIGYVGVTGNAPKNAPHLHFAIFRLTQEKRWWEGTAIDPFDWLAR